MKKTIYSLLALSALYACKSAAQSSQQQSQQILSIIDLVDVVDDKVKVTVDFPEIKASQVEYCLPKTIPGTYSNDNYGRFVEDFKAWDYKGNELKVEKIDHNRWAIPSATQLDKVTYVVNDTFDYADEGNVFSPTGTNIDKDKNYILNLHGFVGYIKDYQDTPYVLEIKRPEFLYPTSALTFSSKDLKDKQKVDQYHISRYFDVMDNPIMYSEPDTLSFKTSGMEIIFSMYSPSKKFKAEEFREALTKTMVAQKSFLGSIDNTDKYAILMYLSQDNKPDARGFGALEHNNSTVVVFPEAMDKPTLEKYLIDVISHEFFHILTPLNVHSKEIHYFDFNNPEMSRHLWMYEGVTEYFANLFQIDQGIIDEADFFNRMTEKINISKNYDDHMSFTHMSANILKEEYQDSFFNVYQKGALIAMCLDIQLRELSNGKMGVIDMMRQLSSKYGKHRPFDDKELIEEITKITYPEIGAFFKRHVEGNEPIPYQEYLSKVGLDLKTNTIETSYFFKDKIPYVDINNDNGTIYFRKRTQLNSFMESIGIKGGDVLKAINGTPISAANYRDPIKATRDWKPGMEVSFLIERDGKEILLKGITTQPTEKVWEIVDKKPQSGSKEYKLRSSWLNHKS